MPDAVVVSGCRTAVGTTGGFFADASVCRLGAVVIREAVRRAGLDGGDVDAVVMGMAAQAGAGPNPARLAAARAGIPLGVPATTLNTLGLSGLQAISLAAVLVSTGQCGVVVAGGMESSSAAPQLLPRSRGGGPIAVAAVTEPWELSPSPLPRGERKKLGEESRRRALAAHAAGRLGEEIVPMPVAPAGGRGAGVIRDRDEALSGRVALPRGWPSPADGAAAVVVMSPARARSLGPPPLASIGAYGTSAGGARSAPEAVAVRDALRRDRVLDVPDLVLLEIHEESAGAAAEAARALGVPLERVNVNGGALAFGHPIGMSGARMVLTLAYELRRRGGGAGAAAVRAEDGPCEGLLISV